MLLCLAPVKTSVTFDIVYAIYSVLKDRGYGECDLLHTLRFL